VVRMKLHPDHASSILTTLADASVTSMKNTGFFKMIVGVLTICHTQ